MNLTCNNPAREGRSLSEYTYRRFYRKKKADLGDLFRFSHRIWTSELSCGYGGVRQLLTGEASNALMGFDPPERFVFTSC